jgi:hypothetical protein
MGAAEKPDLREQIGVAMNASHLAEVPIAAFGAATLAIRLGVDRDDVPIGAAPATVRPVWPWPKSPDAPHDIAYIASELGALLWHARYGRQRNAEPRIAELYVEWLMTRREFAYIMDLDVRRAMLEQFAARVLHEWLSDRCVNCGGSGRQERTRNGILIRPRGTMQRNATFAPCGACGGSGMAIPDKVARARALGIPLGWYDDKRSPWPRRFELARIWLDVLARRLHRPLTAETGRRKRMR